MAERVQLKLSPAHEKKRRQQELLACGRLGKASGERSACVGARLPHTRREAIGDGGAPRQTRKPAAGAGRGARTPRCTRAPTRARLLLVSALAARRTFLQPSRSSARQPPHAGLWGGPRETRKYFQSGSPASTATQSATSGSAVERGIGRFAPVVGQAFTNGAPSQIACARTSREAGAAGT